MKQDGTEQTRLTNNGSLDDFPTWTPTGKILFLSDRDGNGEVYVMNLDGSNQTNLTNNPAQDAYAIMSPK